MKMDVNGEALRGIYTCGAVGACLKFEAITSGYTIIFELDLFTETYMKR